MSLEYHQNRIDFLASNFLPDRRDEPKTENPDHVAFTLLTKKGNKQQMRTVGLPSDSALVINTRNMREAEREEQQQLKQIVLEYEVREEANQRAGKELFRFHCFDIWNQTRCMLIDLTFISLFDL